MLLLLAAVVLVQAPVNPPPRTVAVLATSKRPSVDQYIAVLTARAHALLKREGVGPLLDEAVGIEQLKFAGVTDPRSCQGGRACVARMAVILGSRTVVVGIDVGKAGASLAVIMEAVAADTGQPLLTSEFEVPIATYSDASALPVTLFARELKKKLDAERPVVVPEPVAVTKPVVADAPVVVNLEPPPTPPMVEVTASPTSTRRVLAITTTAAAVVAAGVGVGFALIGNGARLEITKSLSSNQVSTLTGSQLNALQSQTNGSFTGALISGVAAGVLTAVAIYCFASDP